MADGTPDFADLLAAFDDAPPAVSLQQITGTTHGTSLHAGAVQFGGNVPLQFTQGYAENRNNGPFRQINQQGFTTRNQTRQMPTTNPDISSELQSHHNFSDDVTTHGAAADDSFSGGSLGSMFLSSVESFLSDEGTSPYMIQLPQTQNTVQPKTAQRKQRQNQKTINAPSRNQNYQSNKVVQNTEPLSGIHRSQYTNVTQSAASPFQRPVQSQSNAAVHGMKMGTPVSSPPFGMPTDMQGNTGVANLPPNVGGQQKAFPQVQGQFIHPNLGRQQVQPALPNPPRPLSAASSTSDHPGSHPGSVPQPSPSCGSNHSGDPATPLTPQSYNAGTPQSYNPGTPQSNIINQQRQRASGYSELQQIPGQAGQNSNDSFTSNQRTTAYQQQPSPLKPAINTSNDSISNLHIPMKESFVSPINAGSSHENIGTGNLAYNDNSVMMHSIATDNNTSQPWIPNTINNSNVTPALMAPDSLFINKPANNQHTIPASTFAASDWQHNFGASETFGDGFGMPLHNQQHLERADTGPGTASLTSKQNALLDQLSSFGKSKMKQPNFAPPSSLENILESGPSGLMSNRFPEKFDIPSGLSVSESNATLNMMNKANDAGTAAVKGLFSSQATHYEAISPISDYAMSPVSKTTVSDDTLPESFLFSPSKFPSEKTDMMINQDISSSVVSDGASTDPVLMYVKHDNAKHSKTNVNSNPSLPGQFLSQELNLNMSATLKKDLMPPVSANYCNAGSFNRNSQQFVKSSQSSLLSSLSNQTSNVAPSFEPNSALRQKQSWGSSLPPFDSSRFSVDALPFPEPAILNKSSGFTSKNLQSSPLKKKPSIGTSDPKTIDQQGSFGINRRKSSSEKSKVSLSKSKKSSIDTDFGFESDDDAEPTICLSKPTPKTKAAKSNKPESNLMSPKTRLPIATVGSDMKNQMEQLKKLHEQQEMLLKIQKFQEQCGSSAPVSNRGNMSNQQVIPKTQAVPYHRQPHPSSKEKKPLNSSALPKFSSLPLPMLPKVSQAVQPNMRPSIESSIRIATSQSDVPSKESEISKYSSRSSTSHAMTCTSITHGVPTFTSTSSQSLPHFLNFLTTPVTCTGPVSQPPLYSVTPFTKANQTSSSTELSSFSGPGALMQKHTTSSFTPPKAPTRSVSSSVSVSSNVPQHFPLMSTTAPFMSTSASIITSSKHQRMSLLYPPLRSVSDTSITSTISSISSLPINMSLPQKSLPSPTPAPTFVGDNITKTNLISDMSLAQMSSNRPQPFDNRHFDLDWLHREPYSRIPNKSKTPESGRSLVTKTSADTPFQNAATSTHLDIGSAVTVSKPEITSASEEGTVTLKQSIHTVHHVDIPKSHPSTLTNKDSTPVFQETKHLNHKKHRILEAYPQSSDSYKSSINTPSSKFQNGIPTSLAHSVLDKQRRYSKEHSNKKFTHRVSHHVINDKKSISAAQTKQSDLPTVKTANNTGGISEMRRVSSEAEKSVSAVEKPDKKDDDQAGSMLSFFNSLLQEASQSAADSLKTKAEDSDKESENPVEQSPKVSGDLRGMLEAKKSIYTPVTTTLSAGTSNPVAKTSKPVKKTVVQPVHTVKNIPKKNRPAATVPFKRRPYPAIGDNEAVNLSGNTKILPTTLPVSQPTSAGSTAIKQKLVTATSTAAVPLPSSTPNTITPQLTSVTRSESMKEPIQTSKVASTSVNATITTVPVVTSVNATITTVPVVKSVNATITTVPAVTSVDATIMTVPAVNIAKVSECEPATEKALPKISAVPKLRITMFRSSKGQVIHQASMVGNAVNEDSVDSDHTTHKKHKKKKKRKKRKRLSSSDYDSSVSSLTSMSSMEPSIKLTQMANKYNEIASKVIEKTLEQPPPSTQSTPIIKIAPIVDSTKPPQKRKRTKASTVENTEKKKPIKRVKVSKTTTKKKSDTKSNEPIARYQPKSALNSVSPGTHSTTKVSVTLPSAFHRAPGKLPMYMNASDSTSAAVPTIQLVARNTKLLESVIDNKEAQFKTAGSSGAGTLLPKTLSTGLLANTGMQYIIPNSRAPQRIILPNISTPITMPMSLVSPLLGRSLSSGFYPITVSNAKQGISMSFSVSDTVVSSTKVNSKILEANLQSLKPSPKKSSTLAIVRPSDATCLFSDQLSQSNTVTRTLVLPRVTTKVTPTLIPTSTSMNSFQSTFSKLISSQNPISQYVPPDPPEHLMIDPKANKHHQCLECKDKFMLHDSLDDHYDRRCILIKVRCMQCNQNLVFLNKCKLLLHARQHSDKGNGMQFNNAHISPLPLSMCKPRTREEFLNNSASSERRRSSIASSEDETASSGLNTSSTSSDTVMACSECNFLTTSPEALEEHFQRQSTPPSPDTSAGPKPTSSKFTCDMCSLTVSNQCSFNAHMRMHKRSSPHTCPECGKTFDNEGSKEQTCSENKKEIDFNLHLSIECFHLSRMSCYKCRICCSIFKNAELLRRHLEVRHLQTFYKCRDCPMAFKTQENIASHQRSAHGVVAVTKTIHKCPLCDTVFTDNSPTQQLFLLQKHFEGHINHPSINITAYKCLFCNNIYERKSLLREHLKSAHGVTATNESCSDDLTKEINEAQMLMDLSTKENTGGNLKKGIAKKRIAKVSSKEPSSKVPKILSPDRSTFDAASNLRIASGILGNVDGSGKKNLASGKISSASPATMKSARQPVKLRLKGMTAHSDNNLSSTLVSSTSVSKDVSSAADNMPPAILRDGKKVYPCGQCSKELPSASARLNHVKLKHKGIRTLYCCPYCTVNQIKFAKRISLKKHLKRVHSIEEMKKQDVHIEYAKIPIGQRFDPSTFNSNKEESPNPLAVVTQLPEPSGERKQVRKKITSIGRRTSDEKIDRRPIRQTKRNVENGSPIVENSDEEVEKITRNYVEDTEKDVSESPDFSLLRFPNVYVCAKCGFQSKDRLTFQGHIIEHREEAEFDPAMFSTMQQCTECGLCFASVASHAKHMFIKHKIKRIKLLQLYDDQLREGYVESKSEDESTAKKHRCTVCFKRFEDDAQLRTHMRTHGLAFVKSKHVS
ncbi:uncharacterized protein LOC120346731 [Styela clava]